GTALLFSHVFRHGFYYVFDLGLFVVARNYGCKCFVFVHDYILIDKKHCVLLYAISWAIVV
ncbi:hypothetical protein, partial [Desulfamplus magnetovallimortis]|uniref:hypothetical protein n=1 Tax=Desulfamplus magnetovallimortis TaxID=1246637 RepID=UPI001C94139E